MKDVCTQIKPPIYSVVGTTKKKKKIHTNTYTFCTIIIVNVYTVAYISEPITLFKFIINTGPPGHTYIKYSVYQ